MDKRRHRRLNTRLDVFFSIAQSGIHPGTLVDYGKGGVFIAFKTAAQFVALQQQGVVAGRDIQVILTLDEKDHLLYGVVAHLVDAGMGVKFVNVDALAYAALEEAARRAAQSETGNAGALRERGRFDRAAFVKRCADVCQDFFADHLPDFLDNFMGVLLQVAERQKNDADQRLYFDAIAIINTYRNSLMSGTVNGFIDAITQSVLDVKDSVNTVALNIVHTPRVDQDRLSLVEKDDFEDWLLVKVAVSRSELLLREPLMEIGLRLEYAMGIQDKHNGNPFSPAVFFQVIHQELKPLHLNRAVSKLLYRNLVDGLLIRFERLYKSINTLFIQFGILPQLDVARYLADKALKEKREIDDAAEVVSRSRSNADASTPSSPHVVKTHVHPKKEAETNTTNLNADTARDAFSTANKLLRLHRNTKFQTADTETLSPLPLEGAFSHNLHYALSRVSRDLANVVTGDDTENFSVPTLVENRLKQLKVDYADEVKDALHMMDSLVSNIADEQKMTGDLRHQFCKVQVPLLALQMADPEMLQADQHPVRDLLNYLALLAEPSSANFKNNAETVKSVIGRLMLCDPLNDKAVSGLLVDVKKEVDREKRVIERNTQRVIEACDGKQRIQQANDLLQAELSKRLHDKPVPKLVLDLVDAGWKELMRLSLLREGPESRAWQTALHVLDDLLNVLGERPIREDDLFFKKSDLSRLVEKGLQKIANPKVNLARLTADINASMEQEFTELVFNPTPSKEKNDKANEALQPPPKRWLKRVNRLKVGQWLEFGVKTENKKLCQVAWISEDQARMTLVNQQGMKVADLTATQLTEKLMDGDIVLLGDGTVTAVEKGLDALIQKIFEKLRIDTSYDPLTGLLARKEFELSLAQAVARAKRHSLTYVLIYLDILQFKVINNVCGYEGGDQFLQIVANRISDLKIEGQVGGRIGGNEFALITPVANETAAYRVACQVKEAVESLRFQWGQDHYSVSAATALCMFNSTSNQVLELLRTVESGAQFAKSAGHKEVQVVSPGDTRFEKRDSIISWVARISSALDKGQLKLRCQKIAPATELHPDWKPHFEILLSIIDEMGEHLPPAEFVKAAEEYGRMSEVDRWVICEVLQWMESHADYMERVGGFSINLSGHTLNDDTFLDFIFEQFVRHDVPRNKVIFEITETTAVANLDEAADFIAEMKEIGCRFSLDDFGAGQSSYAYLKALPVDFIKIDGAFIKNIDQDKVDFALVKSITDMGHFLNKYIVAEFVSDQAKYDTVVGLGVDYIQGYHIAKPMMLDELINTEPMTPHFYKLN